MSASTNDTEVAGPIVHIIHVDASTTEPTRTVLALAQKDDLTLTVEDETEDFNPAAERRTRRYRTAETVDFELSSAMAVDIEALELIGLVDSNGALASDTASRRLRPSDDEYIEVAYQDAEGNVYADAQLVHRLEDVESVSPEVDMSSTPPIASWTWMVHGTVHFNYTSA